MSIPFVIPLSQYAQIIVTATHGGFRQIYILYWKGLPIAIHRDNTTVIKAGYPFKARNAMREFIDGRDNVATLPQEQFNDELGRL